MVTTCAHLDRVADVAPSSEGCEDCLRTGGGWVPVDGVPSFAHP